MNKVQLIKANQGVVRGEGTSYVITNYLTKETSPKVSVAVSKLDGRLWKTMNKQSDRVYYFIQGKAKFTFDNEVLKAEAGDLIYVPANTPYVMEGQLTAVLINTPAFEVENEIRLD